MKQYIAHVKVMLRKSILDVQGKTVEQGLHSLHMPGFANIRIGKAIELEVTAPDKETATEQVEAACQKLLANPVMEDFSISIVEPATNGSEA